jgi:hypothetical protein
MTLPNSGPVSLASIQTEFGGSNPISLSEYYRGGSLVPNHGNTSNIPTSGTISVNNFYGTSQQAPLDTSVGGASAGNNNFGKYGANARGIQIGARGTDFPAMGTWNNQTFTNSSANTTFTINRITLFTSNLVPTPSPSFELSGDYSLANFSSLTGYNAVRVGNANLMTPGSAGNYSNANSTTSFSSVFNGNSGLNTIPGSGNVTFNFV